MKAGQLKTGMKYWDGSLITVVSQTKCFVVCLLSGGKEMKGKSVEVKWNKNSIINMSK